MAGSTQDRTAAQELLAIYLQDHRAGAAAGLQLVRRSRRAATGDLAVTLAWLETEIEHDRRSLDSIMDGLDIKQSSLKSTLGVVADRAGRLKLNGRLWKRSPLSTLVELEALSAAVFTKRNLWESLASVAERSSIGDARQLRDLVDRATDQLQRLQAHHPAAARQAFDAASTTDGTPPGDATGPATSPQAAVTAPAADQLDRLLEDAEGGIEGSLLDAPADAGGPPSP